MKKLLLFLSLLIASSYVYAGEYGEFGAAFEHPSAPTGATDKVKFVEFGHIDSLKTFERLIAIGGWSDQTRYPGTANAAYMTVALGLETRQPGLYFNYFLGPSLISKTDDLLGSPFEVAQEFGVGMKDARGVAIGFVIKHFSDGGLSQKNYGRNFAGIRAKF